jgi:hypothetical protein
MNNLRQKYNWCQWFMSVNPRSLGGWDGEDWGLGPAWANSSWDPISKITKAKYTGGVAHAGRLACFASTNPGVQSSVPSK